MKNRKLFWSITLVLPVLGFAAGSLLGTGLHEPGVERSSEAVWKEVYRTPAQLAAGADAIALVRMTGVKAGRVAYSVDGRDAVPFQVVRFEVIHALKGAPGDEIFVERAGGVAPDGRTVPADFDGGAFEPGAAYLLFLKRQEDGPYHYQVNLQGRYLVEGDRLWAADPYDAVAKSFESRRVAEGVRLVRAALERGTR